MKQIVKNTVLDNGITILTDYMPHAYSAAIGLFNSVINVIFVLSANRASNRLAGVGLF